MSCTYSAWMKCLACQFNRHMTTFEFGPRNDRSESFGMTPPGRCGEFQSRSYIWSYIGNPRANHQPDLPASCSGLNLLLFLIILERYQGKKRRLFGSGANWWPRRYCGCAGRGRIWLGLCILSTDPKYYGEVVKLYLRLSSASPAMRIIPPASPMTFPYRNIRYDVPPARVESGMKRQLSRSNPHSNAPGT